ncbi:MAG: TIGR03617 family F420-dependent LLM class oxidoreductase [Pseudomonadales bacterium]|jgi:probable F420-dependent oxidoreductase|nr:TIGR03617 family F420-dependent LLM class oxidoreductase [Pseudomonadales bacterium]MDP6472190.1 TIGR03617 family F420-dependent LLM class oxidoreductase [Pseudomonadales bacterium]MDP6826558.1 TIGR03617 family F420-dependent LLM class oxidoreductase [Pseudomonadales bacterium]|tara:strand:+ start:1284 stop:2327 length:1044 start_codon:yes stop_codon:yes gene_type:complete
MKAETLLPLGKLDPGLAAPDAPLDLASVPAQSRIADTLGYHSLLMEETKDDPFQVLAVAAAATRRVRIGTSVAIAFARSPFVTAMSSWTLQKLSAGRFELGLGSQVRGHIRRRFGLQWHPPGPWMRDYVNAVRAIWASWQNETALEFSSDHYDLDLTVPLFTPAPIDYPDIPILIAAVNPYMCRVAAEVGDGVRLHPVCSARYIRETVSGVVETHRISGRPFEVCLKPLIATARDERTLAQRRETARQRLAFYVSTPAYRAPFELAGLGDLAAELSELSRHRRWDEMARRIDDEVLNEWVVIASYDELASVIHDRYGALIDRIEVSIPVISEADRDALACVIRDLHA